MQKSEVADIDKDLAKNKNLMAAIISLGLEEIVEAIKPVQPTFASIEEVLKADDRSIRKRGRHK